MAVQLCYRCKFKCAIFSLTTSNAIQKITPIMLADITYGTFLLFGSACIVMGIYTIFCVPETKGVPLESIHILFEGSIVAGCVKDTFPATSRAKKIRNTHYADEVEEMDGGAPKKNRSVEHVETA